MYVFAVIHRKLSMISAAARHKRVKQKLEILARFYEGIKRQLRPTEEFEFLAYLYGVIYPSRDDWQPPLYVTLGGTKQGQRTHAS